jgi:hypothetical protein
VVALVEIIEDNGANDTSARLTVPARTAFLPRIAVTVVGLAVI